MFTKSWSPDQLMQYSLGEPLNDQTGRAFRPLSSPNWWDRNLNRSSEGTITWRIDLSMMIYGSRDRKFLGSITINYAFTVLVLKMLKNLFQAKTKRSGLKMMPLSSEMLKSWVVVHSLPWGIWRIHAENKQQWEIQESSVNLHYFTCTLHSDTLNKKVKSTHDFRD